MTVRLRLVLAFAAGAMLVVSGCAVGVDPVLTHTAAIPDSDTAFSAVPATAGPSPTATASPRPALAPIRREAVAPERSPLMSAVAPTPTPPAHAMVTMADATIKGIRLLHSDQDIIGAWGQPNRRTTISDSAGERWSFPEAELVVVPGSGEALQLWSVSARGSNYCTTAGLCNGHHLDRVVRTYGLDAERVERGVRYQIDDAAGCSMVFALDATDRVSQIELGCKG